MQLTKCTLVAALALWAAPMGVVAIEDCTPEEAATVQSVQPQTTIAAACPGLQFDAGGAPDLSNTGFCSTAKCVKTIKKVRKALPKCKLNGVKVRSATKKLLEACGEGDGEDDGDNAGGSGSSNTAAPPATVGPGGETTAPGTTPEPSSKTPKPSKTPKHSKTPKSDEKDAKDGSGKDGSGKDDKDDTKMTKAPKSTKPSTALFPSINEADLKKDSAASTADEASSADGVGKPIGTDGSSEALEEMSGSNALSTNTTTKTLQANRTPSVTTKAPAKSSAAVVSLTLAIAATTTLVAAIVA